MNRNNAAPAPAVWVLAAVLPALCHASLVNTLAWIAALVIGAQLADGRLIRWVPVAWVVSTAVPGTPVLATVASGSSATGWGAYLRIAVVGLALATLWPAELRNAGAFLLIAGMILALQGSEA